MAVPGLQGWDGQVHRVALREQHLHHKGDPGGHVKLPLPPLPLDACVNDVKGFSLLAGSGGILWYGQVGLERIARGLEVLKASDHMVKFNALNICSELSV